MRRFLIGLLTFFSVLLVTQDGWARFIQPNLIPRRQVRAAQLVLDRDPQGLWAWFIEIHNLVTSPPRNQTRAGRNLPGGNAVAVTTDENGWGQPGHPITHPKYFFTETPGGMLRVKLFHTENGVKTSIVSFSPDHQAFRFNTGRVTKNGIIQPVVRNSKGGIISTGGYGLTEELIFEDFRLGPFITIKRNGPDNTAALNIAVTPAKMAELMITEDHLNGVEDIPPPPPSKKGTIRLEGAKIVTENTNVPGNPFDTAFLTHDGDTWCQGRGCSFDFQLIGRGDGNIEISMCSIPQRPDGSRVFNIGRPDGPTGKVVNWTPVFEEMVGEGISTFFDGQNGSYQIDRSVDFSRLCGN